MNIYQQRQKESPITKKSPVIIERVKTKCLGSIQDYQVDWLLKIPLINTCQPDLSTSYIEIPGNSFILATYDSSYKYPSVGLVNSVGSNSNHLIRVTGVHGQDEKGNIKHMG